MARDWESTFRDWTKPSSETEQAKQENAERMVRDAIKAHPWFNDKHYRVYTKGSYKNNTNVRIESDVDVVVETSELIYTNKDQFNPFDYGRAKLVEGGAPYTMSAFKNEVEKALVAKFGASNVKRGGKAINIAENSYHVTADVVPCAEYRFYYEDYTYRQGTMLVSDSGERITGYPQQQYENGVIKNTATHGRYKFMVRALKRLQSEMEGYPVDAAQGVASFLIECLVWIVPNSRFGNATYYEDMRAILAYLFNETLSDERCSEWTEVNGFKFLFRKSQPWTRQQVHDFVGAAWTYVGFA